MSLVHSKKPTQMYAHGGESCMACGGAPCRMAGGGALKGVHEPYRSYQGKGGESHAGFVTKNKLHSSGSATPRKEHEENLKELKTMPNPKLKGLADGGQVTTIDPDKAKSVSDSFKGALGFGHAEGGEIESAEHEASESPEYELSEMAADELMSAIESKDKSRIVSSMRALVASCMNDGDSDD